MASVKIIDRRKLPSGDPTRLGKEDVLIMYDAGEGKTGVVRLPAEAADEAQVREAIKADLAERAGWVGKTLEL